MSDQIDAFTVSGLPQDRYDAFVHGWDACAKNLHTTILISDKARGKIRELNEEIAELNRKLNLFVVKTENCPWGV